MRFREIQLSKSSRLFVQWQAGYSYLLNECSVLMYRIVELSIRSFNQTDNVGLLLASLRNLRGHIRHLVDFQDYFIECFALLIHKFCAIVDDFRR